MSIEKLIKVLKEVGKIPQLKETYISKLHKTFIHIEGLWSFKNYSNDESNILHSSYIYDMAQNQVHSSVPTLMDKRTVLSAVSPCNSKSACLLQDDKCCYLNIYCEGEQAISLNLKNEDTHGKVYNDADLSSFSWSSDSKLITFVAEKKRPKTTSFLAKKSESNKDGWGEKYAYIDDWGEQMSGQSTSVIVVVNTITEEINVLNLPDGICGGQVIWTPQGTLMGVAFITDPYRLGLIYCTNRESVLFSLTLDGSFDELTPRGSCARFPRFSPDGLSLVFCRGPVGGPHMNNMQLCLLKWKEREVCNLNTVVLIDYVDKEQKIPDNKSFHGLYGNSTFPLRCWSEDSRSIVFTSCDNFAAKTYIINIDSKAIHEVPSEGSLVVHDVTENYMLASRSSLTEPSCIVLIPLTSGLPGSATMISLPRRLEGIPVEWQDYWAFINPNPHPKEVVSASPIPALYFGPTQLPPDGTKRPLVVWVHGGPHSSVNNTFIPGAAFFVRLGYSVLFPNFRGSLGQGRLALESLPGNIGSADVDDVYQATLRCLERYSSVLDETRVVLYGGSHGGFLVTHLSAQHGDLYKVVSTRNPVVDIAMMSEVSDIPDWCFVESGFKYKMEEPPTAQTLSKMHELSPLSILKKVKAPTLLLLGEEDRRVPHSQGLFYFKMLLANKVPTKTYVYDDCHPLSKPDVEADCLLRTVLWYQEYL